jgi:hypothetical protein
MSIIFQECIVNLKEGSHTEVLMDGCASIVVRLAQRHTVKSKEAAILERCVDFNYP